MSNDRRLLWAYPKQWRHRYGAELIALIEDQGGSSRRVQLSLVRAGLHERLREQSLTGRDSSPIERVRAGSRVILVAWAALVVAGCGFAKFSEQWQVGVPSHDRLVPDLAYGAVVVLACVGAAALLSVLIAALSSLRGVITSAHWREFRRPVLVAIGLSLAALAATGGVVLRAQYLTPAQRNGSSPTYLAAFLCWALVIIAMIAAWAIAAIAVERELEVTPRLARTVAIASGVLSTCAVLIAGSILAWWISLARTAPWALQGGRAGTTASPWSWPLAVEAAVATTAAVLALFGATRLVSAARSRRHTI